MVAASEINHRPRQQPSTSFWVRALAAVGALWIAFHSVIWVAKATRHYWRTATPAATFLAPGSAFKAVLFLSMGGGPATSYCGTSVYVVPAGTPDAEIGGDDDLVYSGNCGGMSEGHWDENVTWKNPQLLQIEFDPTAAASEGGLKIRSKAVRGTVAIQFKLGPVQHSW